MEKFLIESMPTDLARSKNKDYQENLAKCRKSLYVFLYKNGLLLVNPLNSDESLSRTLEIYSTDLTPAGLDLFKKPVQAWYKARSKDRNYENLSILEKALSMSAQK
jgi:hypothetical protein